MILHDARKKLSASASSHPDSPFVAPTSVGQPTHAPTGTMTWHGQGGLPCPVRSGARGQVEVVALKTSVRPSP